MSLQVPHNGNLKEFTFQMSGVNSSTANDLVRYMVTCGFLMAVPKKVTGKNLQKKQIPNDYFIMMPFGK